MHRIILPCVDKHLGNHADLTGERERGERKIKTKVQPGRK